MIADPRSQALVRNFTGQWLNVRGIAASEPVVNLFPDFDSTLRAAFRREVELSSPASSRRPQVPICAADYTFVTERLAKPTHSRGLRPAVPSRPSWSDQTAKRLLERRAEPITSDAKRTSW